MLTSELITTLLNLRLYIHAYYICMKTDVVVGSQALGFHIAVWGKLVFKLLGKTNRDTWHCNFFFLFFF